MKRILLLGSSSFTGFHISQNLMDKFDIVRASRSGQNVDLHFDVDSDDVSQLEETLGNVDVVVNCISNGDVDSCEKNPDQATAINFDFVAKLVALQKTHNFHLVHFSTNAIYDGENAPYTESSDVNPINRYGRIKAQADKHIQDNSPKYTILRPITMFGVKLEGQRHNPFSFFYQQLLDNKDIVAVDDVYVNMLHVADLVKCVEEVIKNGVVGTFNISGDDIVNRYDFVSLIKSFIPSSTSEISKVSSDQFVTAAERPRNTSFNNSQMKNELKVFPKSIESVLGRLVSMTQADERKAA